MNGQLRIAAAVLSFGVALFAPAAASGGNSATLYVRSTQTNGVAGSYDLAPARGAGVASSGPVGCVQSDTPFRTYYSTATVTSAVTLSGAFTASLRGVENNVGCNNGYTAIFYYRRGSSDTAICSTGASAEWGTGETAVVASCTATATLQPGDRLRVDWIRSPSGGTGNPARNTTLYWDGATTGGSGDSYVALPACTPGVTDTCTVPVTGVAIAPKPAAVYVGTTQQFSAALMPSNATNQAVTWSVPEGSQCGTVSSSGLYTAPATPASPCTVRVTTQDGAFTDASPVTIKVPVSSVTIAPKSVIVPTGATQSFTATVSPASATDKSVTWSATCGTFTSATANPATYVAPPTPATCTITATTTDGARTDSTTVTVTQPVTGVAVSPVAQSLSPGGALSLTAVLSPANATNQAVTWSVVEGASAGSLSSLTANPTTYTAPTTPGTYHVLVTTQDGGYTATAAITVNQPVTGVSVSPAAQTLSTGALLSLTAIVSPASAANKNVAWSISEGAAGGSLSSPSANPTTYTAPGTPGTYHVVVTTQDGGFTATSTLTVTQPVTGVAISPKPVTLASGGAQTFTATVAPANASDRRVTWSATCGTFGSATANPTTYTAPAGPATCTVSVTTVDGARTDATIVTVNAPVVAVTAVTVSPNPVTLASGASQAFTASVTPANATDPSVTWTATCGTFSSTAANPTTYTAPPGPATCSVTATTADGARTDSAAVTVSAPPPGAPGAPAYRSVTATSLVVNWSAASSATGYEVFRSTDGSTWPATATGLVGDVLEWQDAAVTPNVRFYYKVRATNGGGAGPFSGATSQLTLPGAVVALRVANSTWARVDLAWSPPAGGAATYAVLRSQDGTLVGAEEVGNSATPAWSDTSVAGSTAYSYWVQARNATGGGDLAGPAATTTPIAPPEAPGTPTFSAIGTGSVHVSWSPAARAATYQLERAPDAGGTPGAYVVVASGLAVAAADDASLAPFTTYWYRVTATNASGNGPCSPAASVRTLAVPPGPPGAPTFSNVLYSSVKLTWTAASDATSYKVERAPDVGGSAGAYAQLAAGVAVTAYSDATVAPSTRYWYRVRGTNTAGDGPYSAGASVRTADPPAVLSLTSPGAQPTGAALAAGKASVLVARLRLASTNGSAGDVVALRLSNAGTGAARDVAAVQLWDDANGNGVLEPAIDTLLATGAWSATAGKWSFSAFRLNVPGAAARTLLVALTVAPGASAGKTFVAAADPADVTVLSPASMAAGPTVTGSAFTYAAGPTDGNANAAAPVVSVVNPGNGAAVSGAFRVQVQVFDPAGLASVRAVKLSTDNGATWPRTLTAVNTNYDVGANAAVFEAQLTLDPGAYTLRAQATNALALTTSSGAVLVKVAKSGRGDGNLLRRDNSSQLCSDCHAIQTHSSQHVGPKYGSWSTNCRDCHTPHGTSNAHLVAGQITPPSLNGYQPTRDVYLSNKSGYSGVAGATDKANASYANSDFTGVCQVCHTQTTRYRNDGGIEPSHGGNCAMCHAHTGGFTGKLCLDCHGDATRTAITGADPSLQAAPPRDHLGNTSPTAAGVGVHLAHLNRADSAIKAAPLACTDCHPSPAPHSGVPSVKFAAGTLGAKSWPGQPEIAPSWDAANLTCNGTYCHGNFKSGAAASPRWNAPGTLACDACHGTPPRAPHEQVTDCERCHLGYTITTANLELHLDGKVDLGVIKYTCQTCHGIEGRQGVAGADPNVASSPPLDVAKTSDGPKVGAHLAHLDRDPAVAIAPPTACAECHTPVPTSMDHSDGSSLPVFGALAVTGGATPGYDPVELRCSSTYCHGAFQYGSQASVRWGDGAAGRACGACHGVPPPGAHPQNANCERCHAGYTASTVAVAQHVNGRNDMDAARTGCVACHGDPARASIADADPNQRAAPPFGTRDETLTSTRSVGAHLAHLNQATLRSRPIACAECHPDRPPGDTTHADGVAQMAWGPLATAASAAPTWNGAACSNYCHGATFSGGSKPLPSWTGGPGEVAGCGACHGNPPPLLTAPYHPSNASCTDCHGAGYSTSTFVAATHLDGVVALPNRSGACNRCHGYADGFAANDPANADANVIATPGTKASNGALAVGAHAKHVNPALQAAGGMSKPFRCTECHGAAKQSAADHVNGDARPDMVTAAVVANAGPMSPAPTYGAGTCSNTYCHAKYATGIYAGGSPNAHAAPSWTETNTAGCGYCHGDPPSAKGHPKRNDCSACHAGYSNVGASPRLVNAADHVNGTVEYMPLTCTSCHGQAARTNGGGSPIAGAAYDVNQVAMPPTDASGRSSSALVGTHAAHSNPAAAGATYKPILCSECHGDVSAYTMLHEDGVEQMTFALATGAKLNGFAPTYVQGNGSTTPTTCATYCHGASLDATTTRGARASWAWDGAPAGCADCHLSPPTTANHHNAAQLASCVRCHATTVDAAGGVLVTAGQHIDGVVQSTMTTCAACHGSPSLTPSGAQDSYVAAAPTGGGAPDTYGNTSPSAAGVGVHGAHVLGTRSRPVLCNACHAGDPALAGTLVHRTGVASAGSVAFADLGAGTGYGASKTCSASYCHGNFRGGSGAGNITPAWTAAGALSCNACHPAIPASSSPIYHPTNLSCASCHGPGFSWNGTSGTVDPTLHVDGAVALPNRTGTCNRCHGSQDGYVAADPANVDPNVIAAPGTAATAGALAVGAHRAHVDQADANPYMKAIHCTECHGADKTAASDHADGDAAPLWTASVIATAGGMTNPSYVSSDGTCSSTYCHGKYADAAFGGATTPNPRWATTGKLGCDSCHGDPPLKLPDGQSAHTTDTNCSACHSGYADKGASPRFVDLERHLNGNVEASVGGNAACTSCHGGLLAGMRSTSGYHHYMNNADVTALASGSKYPNTAAIDGTGDANRRCLMCHVDHDVFSVSVNAATGGAAKNLRTDVTDTAISAASGAGFTNTDFDASLANGGICVSCHNTALTKSYAQLDGTTRTPAVTKPAYAASAHSYDATSTFGDGTTYRANCSKCHNDTLAKTTQTSAAPNQFGLHDSAIRRENNLVRDIWTSGVATGAQTVNLLVDTSKSFAVGQYDGFVVTLTDANGTRSNIVRASGVDNTGARQASTLVMLKPWATAPLTGATYTINDPSEERLCGQCHSGAVAGPDGLAAPGVTMSARSRRFDQYLKVYGYGTISIAAGATSVTGVNTGWYTSDATATATFAKGNETVTLNKVVAGAGPSWLGKSIKTGNATVRWYTIVAVNVGTSSVTLTVSPPPVETVSTTSWAVGIGDWYLQCDGDAGWYRITNVTSATAAAIYPAYGGLACANATWVARSAPGHPLAVTAATHRPDEAIAPGWSTPGSATTPRHVTCADCHDPHSTRAGNHTLGTAELGAANAGVAGVAVSYAPVVTAAGTFTNASRTVNATTSVFTAASVGKNILGPDGIVYPIAQYNSGTQVLIGLTAGYKGATVSGATFQIQDPATGPTYTVVNTLTTSNKQYELCLKCHSAFAYGTTAPTTMFYAASGNGATASQTDVAKDFNPYQLAYHPILAVGRNQPSPTLNPNWATSPGRKKAAPNSGLDNTFVDGWGAQSLLVCSDCHQSESAGDPWGPHGTAHQWQLKGIDPTVTVTLADGTLKYPNTCYSPGSSVANDTGDTKNFCLNCHRSDVYGMVNSSRSTSGWSCNGATLTNGIPYSSFSRMTHPADGQPAINQGQSNMAPGALTRFGIFCMQCHGGQSLGGIHGTNADPNGGGSYRGKRFMNGGTWSKTTRATTTAGVSCTTNPSSSVATSAVNTCNDSRSSTGNVANYNYDPGAD